jgi:hypothetical protein
MIGTIKVGNKRAGAGYKPELSDVVINIDRPHVLGNPYVISRHCSRQHAIELFRNDLDREMHAQQGPRYKAICEIIEHLRAGRDVTLMCWCQPLDCHGHYIKQMIEQLLQHERQLAESQG